VDDPAVTGDPLMTENSSVARRLLLRIEIGAKSLTGHVNYPSAPTLALRLKKARVTATTSCTRTTLGPIIRTGPFA